MQNSLVFQPYKDQCQPTRISWNATFHAYVFFMGKSIRCIFLSHIIIANKQLCIVFYTYFFNIYINTHTHTSIEKHIPKNSTKIHHISAVKKKSDPQIPPSSQQNLQNAFFGRKMFSRFHHCTLTNLYGPTVPLSRRNCGAEWVRLISAGSFVFRNGWGKPQQMVKSEGIPPKSPSGLGIIVIRPDF